MAVDTGVDAHIEGYASSWPGGAIVSTNITAHITGTIWKIEKKPGDAVAAGDSVVIIESMKMEVPVESPKPGKIIELRCSEGQLVEEGAVLAVLE
jgi:acetyl-CoA carboxylase biotin carboxyl carrier protein